MLSCGEPSVQSGDRVSLHAVSVGQAAQLFDLEQTRLLLRSLSQPRALIYWSDMLLCSALGWGAIVFAVCAPFGNWQMIVGVAVAAICFYRGLAFSHELAHAPAQGLRGFRSAWDALIGYPLLLPSILYVGMHADHHRTQSYGTPMDPEYQPFAGKPARIISFALHTLLLCPVAMVRFFVLGPLGLLIPRLHGWLERRASSLTFNPLYERSMTAQQRRALIIAEILVPLIWGAVIATAIQADMALNVLLVFYATYTLIGGVNAVRTLGAHRYQSDGEPRNKYEQVLDSVDTPGNILTELWAPVGLRYHALHHLFPNVPYHNMGILHRELVKSLTVDADYRDAITEGLPQTLVQLCKPRGN